jgi:3-methyladenine DNA glycosylase AlkD
MTADDVIKALEAARDPAKAAFFPRFFKAGPGEYAEGDIFLGVTVPKTREIVKAHRGIPLSEIPRLLANPVHEVRLAGLLLLVAKFEKGDDAAREEIVRCYLDHVEAVNNWDLVDTSTPHILGRWLMTRDRSLLYEFARSGHLWKERIAVIATFAFIRAGEHADTFAIAEILLQHEHDLIHKAVGWMLREVGNRDRAALDGFLEKYAAVMPPTMLRYAIEKHPEPARKRYMGMRKAAGSGIMPV